jgi:glycosyltransferase involved in cell wall biosynthesis
VNQKLYALENQINPDLVFSIFGPTYWRPKSKHLMGFALPWITNPNTVAFSRMSYIKRFKKKLEGIYKRYYLKRDADYYVVQTDATKKGLGKEVDIPLKKIFVVGNTFDSSYQMIKNKTVELLPRIENEFRLITITHYYPHKNLEIIKAVLPYLEHENENYIFYITIDQDKYDKLFKGYEKSIKNLGPLPVDACPYVYKQCDALFHPTLLECFSASYPEAMKMQLPILTSNYSFAKDVCQDTALYFDPLDPKDIAEKIIKLSTDNELQRDLVKKGIERLKDFETAESRARKYLEICETIARKDKIDG